MEEATARSKVLAKDKRSAEGTHYKSTLSCKTQRVRKERWVSTNKMPRVAPCSMDYIHQGLGISGCSVHEG